jgi:hypothetical protein
MEYEKIILAGVEYKLVPTEPKQIGDVEYTLTHTCLSDCEQFEFFVLLNQDGEIIPDTSCLTVFKDSDDQEIWDSSTFLLNVIKEQTIDDSNLAVTEVSTIVALLNKVHELGWL